MKKNTIYGIHPVTEAIKAGKDFDKILIQRDLSSPSINAIRNKAREKGIKLQNVPINALNKITGKNHQGIIAFTLPIELTQLDQLLPSIYDKGESPLLIILDRISDVRNFGAICRTAECAGAHGVVIPGRGAAQLNADAVKTSSGALNRIPVCREDNLMESITLLKNSGLKIVACTEKAGEEIYDVDMQGPLAIIVGSEETGISKELIEISDERAAIPLKGETASLNVSVASALALFEGVRQRRKA